ncbi:hypothetical protein AYI69_g6509 [Smittium culicis]|uniref:Uncharacterized protein n=1 Tax=Smittium culicis TaxID=133412 RepID=A0A1R1XYG7_9FUNG|nr:hypothetical protein AYI69_g6509 [Smittium culicis]
MEWSFVLSQDSEAGDFYRRQRPSLGNSSRTPLLLGYMEPQSVKTAYQHKGTVDSVVFAESQECRGTIGVSLLRKHSYTFLFQEIRGHDLPESAGINRKYMVSLPQDQHLPTSNICTIDTKPSERHRQTNSAKQIFFIIGDILSTKLSVWAPRHRPLFIIPEQEPGTILQLILRSVLLPTLEPDITGSSECPPLTSHNDTCDSNVEIRNLAPRPDVAISLTATSFSSDNFRSRSENRKVTALEKQEFELDDLEEQRRFLKTQGLGTYAIDFIVLNRRRVRSRSRYSSIQQRFLEWRISNEISTSIFTPQVINYLAEIYTVDKLKLGSIKTYKSAILQILDSPAVLAAHPMFSEFINEFDDTSIYRSPGLLLY